MSHPPAQPHGPLTEIFPDVYTVEGSFRIAPGMTIPRVMTVIREGARLVVVSAMRLDEAGEAALAKLGKVEHLVKLGDFHNLDDRYYQDRFQARIWAVPDAKLAEGVKATDTLVEGGPVPVADGSFFHFRGAKRPEGAMLLAREGGVLLTVDSLQYYEEFGGPHTSTLAKFTFKLMGFKLGMNVGPAWRRQVEPKDGVGFKPEFERLLALPFRHLQAAHGAVCRDRAHELVAEQVGAIYSKG